MTPRPAARVAGLRRTAIRELFEALEGDEVNLGLGQVDLPVPDPLSEALREAATAVGGYGSTAGDPALREAVASSYPGFARGADDVVITAGCQQATFAAIGALADAGDEVLVPDPGFPGAARAAAAWGAVPRPYPLHAANGYHLDPDELLALVGPRCRAAVVISPSNPTGAVEPAASLERLADGLERRGVALVLDDTYRDLCWTGAARAPGPPPGRGGVVVCGSVSKSPGLAAWRVGWIVCTDDEFTARLTALMQTLHSCPASPTQRAARRAFDEAGRAASAAIAATFRRRRRIVLDELAGCADAGPLEGGFYAWVTTPGDAARFARELLRDERIVVVPGEAFGASGTRDRVRISYACEEATLAAALKTIAPRLRD